MSELGAKWLDNQISEAFGISTRTVERVRERLVQEGIESALNRAKPIRVKSRVIDGEKEAHLLALACGDAPDGRIPDQETLKMEIAAWQEKRNAMAQPMEWRFTNEDARVKLKKLYPILQE
jgi:transposase